MMTRAATIGIRQSRLAVSLPLTLLVWGGLQDDCRLRSGDSPGWLALGGDGLISLVIGLFNTAATSNLSVALRLGATCGPPFSQSAVLHWMDALVWLRGPVALLLRDVSISHWYCVNHRIPFFPRFHTLHHSDRFMEVTSVNRFRLSAILLSSLWRIPILLLIGCRNARLALHKLLLFTVVLFHLATLGLPEPLNRPLRSVLVTPHLHQVLHTVFRGEYSSNYRSFFSWCDRLFGAIRFSPNPQTIIFGVDKLQFRRWLP